MGKERIEFQIDQEVKKKAEISAKTAGLSLSAWIRTLIITSINLKK